MKLFKDPIDRSSILTIVALAVAIALVLSQGDRTLPQVKDFSWQGKTIGVEDTAFILTFNRPMERESVEKNLQINPYLPGKMSWAGRRMAYTPMQPAPYGNTYAVKLEGAREKYYGGGEGKLIKPFQGFFNSRDRALVYIGLTGEEKGRLMLVNFEAIEPKPIALTPSNLAVMDFKFYPLGDRLLFSALERKTVLPSLSEQQLFTVTTGINPVAPGEKPKPPEEAGQVELILDNKDYQNLKFDLSPDGKTIVVQRVKREDTSDSAPWIIEEGKKARYLTDKEGKVQQGGDFLIAPDSKSIVLLQGQGISILPLNAETDFSEDLMFLPKFGRVLSFARDGTRATMVKYNTDGARSLYIVTNQGEEKEIFKTAPYGNILEAKFDPTKTVLYCLLSRVLEDEEEYEEELYIAKLNLKTNELKTLIILPNQREVEMSLSPDGLALLFDQTVTQTINNNSGEDSQGNGEAEAIATSSRIWLLPLISDTPTDANQVEVQPEQLPFAGFSPRWLP